jgi:hydroxymethylpyrimidine/phosphomethylpyrimidine kinase
MSGRPTVLSIAGFDPCGGAGLLADVKTFEQHRVHGIAVCTAQTLQTEHCFVSIKWEAEEFVLQSIEHLLDVYSVRAVKIGIVQSIESLASIVSTIRRADSCIHIVLDPVIRSTTNFNFWQDEINRSLLFETLEKISVITPNHDELLQLMPASSAKVSAEKLSRYCSVLFKGGHNKQTPGVDYLFSSGQTETLSPSTTEVHPKHGSGCVLSAAIASNLALGRSLSEACRTAKSFTEKFLLSNSSLLGYHAS